MALHQFDIAIRDAEHPNGAVLTDAVIRQALGPLPLRIGNGGKVADMIAAQPSFLFLQPFEDSFEDLMGGSPAYTDDPGVAYFDGPNALDGSRYISLGIHSRLVIPRTGLFPIDRKWTFMWRWRMRDYGIVWTNGGILGNLGLGADCTVYGAADGLEISLGVDQWHILQQLRFPVDPARSLYAWNEFLLRYDPGADLTFADASIRLWINGVERIQVPSEPGSQTLAGAVPATSSYPLCFNQQAPWYSAGQSQSADLDLVAYYEDALDPSAYIVGTGTACWYWTPEKDVILRSFIVPGTDGDAGVDITEGSDPPVHVNGNSPDLAIALHAGVEVKFCVDVVRDLYIGSDLGNGPAAIFDEPVVVVLVPVPSGELQATVTDVTELRSTIVDQTAIAAVVED